MTWQAMCLSTEPKYYHSASESKRFGFDIFRVEVPNNADHDKSWRFVSDAVYESKADVIVLRYPAGFSHWFADLLRTDRDIIHADTFVFWSANTNTIDTSGYQIDPYRADWESTVDDEIRDLARNAFTKFSNHYAANPLFDHSLTAEGYVEWTENVAEQGHLLVLRDKNNAAISYRISTLVDGVWEGIVGGTLPSARRGGAFVKALQESVTKAIEMGAETIVVSSQVQNFGTLRTYAKHFPLLPHAAFNTVHLVKKGLLPK